MNQTLERRYEVDPSGIIFTSVVTVITADDGTVARTNPYRVPYTPGQDMSDNPDTVLKGLAAQVWTPDVVAAYQAAQAANQEQ